MANDKFTTIDLDSTLDDIDDLPQFSVFPTGAYVVNFHKGVEDKMINKHPALILECLLKEIVELDPKNLDAGSPMDPERGPNPGDIATLVYMRDNEFGMGNFKADMASIAIATGVKSIRELLTATKNIDAMIVVTRTYDKEKDRRYMKAKKIAVL